MPALVLFHLHRSEMSMPEIVENTSRREKNADALPLPLTLYRKQLAARFDVWRLFTGLAQNPSAAF